MKPGMCPYGGGHTITWTGTISGTTSPGYYACARCHSVVVLPEAFLAEVQAGLEDAKAGRWVDDADLEEFMEQTP